MDGWHDLDAGELPKLQTEKLESFGFRHDNNFYTYEEHLLAGDFRMLVRVDGNGAVSTLIIDTDSNEPYVLHLVENAQGSFVGEVRAAYQDTIKHCSVISFVFLILTYLTTVNIEGQFVSVNSVWISNNFLVTLFGGVFASMLVVVLCEIQKYLSAKNNTEYYLFYQSVYLYQALVQMKINAKDYIEHRELQIPVPIKYAIDLFC